MSIYLYNLLTFLLVILFIIGFVTIVMWFKKKEGERKTNIILTALEKGQTITPELLGHGTSKKTWNKYILMTLLCLGCGTSIFAVLAIIASIVDMCIRGEYYVDPILPCVIFTCIGASLLIAYFKGKDILRPELEEEEKNRK